MLCYRNLPRPRGKGPIIPKIAAMPTFGDHKPGDFFFWTNTAPPPTTTTKPSKSDPPGNFQFCFDSPLHPGVSRTSDVVRTREVQENGGKMTVPDWGRQIFFSLNYMEVQQTKGLKNWDCTKFILVYTTQAEQ